ncbi:MAG: sulfite exporter TauE/SafE family protein [Clostridiales bacterium]|nr:sulfite exporter TauE/SafE family protein [Clostridiales bacterium]
MNLVTIGIVSFFSGIMASMGLGGGMVLILYLTLFTSTGQLEAQGINLVFFVPIAIFALIIHTKNKLVKWKKIVPALITGTIFALIFSYVANNMDNMMLKKFFGFFIIAAGIREFFNSKSESKD